MRVQTFARTQHKSNSEARIGQPLCSKAALELPKTRILSGGLFRSKRTFEPSTSGTYYPIFPFPCLMKKTRV
jgi:hypothetical protein